MRPSLCALPNYASPRRSSRVRRYAAILLLVVLAGVPTIGIGLGLELPPLYVFVREFRVPAKIFAFDSAFD